MSDEGQRVKHLIARTYTVERTEVYEVWLEAGDDPFHAVRAHRDAFREDVLENGSLVSVTEGEPDDEGLYVVEEFTARVIPMRGRIE